MLVHCNFTVNMRTKFNCHLTCRHLLAWQAQCWLTGPTVFVYMYVCVGGTSHFACCILQVAEVSHLDDEIMALHSEIVELQRSPYARRQGDKMEQL